MTLIMVTTTITSLTFIRITCPWIRRQLTKVLETNSALLPLRIIPIPRVNPQGRKSVLQFLQFMATNHIDFQRVRA